MNLASFRHIIAKILKYQISLKLRAVGAELFHAELWRDRQDEANSRLSQFCHKRL